MPAKEKTQMPDQTQYLSDEERKILLTLARESLEKGVTGSKLPELPMETLSSRLRSPGASFVTLSRRGELRGCIGAIEPYQPLAEDVREHAIAAALQDYRFPPVIPEELPEINIEISCLTQPDRMDYEDADDLLKKLRPGIDGVVLKDGFRRATFLPQVWEKIPQPQQFMDHLCQKMGVAPGTWRMRRMEVWIYQVEEFHE